MLCYCGIYVSVVCVCGSGSRERGSRWGGELKNKVRKGKWGKLKERVLKYEDIFKKDGRGGDEGGPMDKRWKKGGEGRKGVRKGGCSHIKQRREDNTRVKRRKRTKGLRKQKRKMKKHTNHIKKTIKQHRKTNKRRK